MAVPTIPSKIEWDLANKPVAIELIRYTLVWSFQGFGPFVGDF